MATAILLVAIIPSAGSTENHDGGTFVRATHPDVAMAYEQPNEISICFVDLDGDAHYGQGDSVVLAFRPACSGNSQSNDIRLVQWHDWSPGARLGSAPDQGVTLAALSPEPRFYYLDHDGDNTLGPGDSVYLRMQNSAQGLIRTGDIRITASNDHPAGTRVESTDPDNGLLVTPLGTAAERIRHVDVLATNTFNSRDLVYLTSDTSRTVAKTGDVRIYTPEPTLPFGTFIGLGDPEPQDTVRKISRYACFVDETNTGIYTPSDPFYLSIWTECTGNVQVGDIRLSNTTHGPAGSRVQQDDEVLGRRYIVLPDARAAYIDLSENNRFTRDDVAVLRISDPTEDSIQAGDLILTPTNRGAGAMILEDDPIIGTNVQDLGRVRDIIVFKPTRTTTSVTDDAPFYLSPGTGTGQSLKPNDIRLVPVGDHPFGAPTGHDTGELPSPLQRGEAGACSTTSIPGDYIAGDPVYLRLEGPCPITVTEGLLRLVPVDDHEAFTRVVPGDSDIGRTLLAPEIAPQLRFFSVGETGWSYSSRLYLNLVDPNSQNIQVGDIRLTTAGEQLSAGRPVLSGDTDRTVTGLTLLGPLSEHTGWIDHRSSLSFSSGDIAYITPTTTHDHVTPLMVRLISLPAPFHALTVQPPADPQDPSPGPWDDDDTDSGDTDQDDADPTDGDDGDEEDEDTPGLAIAMALVVVLAALAFRRRHGSH